ncbi:MAG TPA: acyl-CoA dehydrogenase family protein [Mycobacteriales bacterium]|nr:acyl-CoA dehydrogenase family protein [Mycobacteriales bacterium]
MDLELSEDQRSLKALVADFGRDWATSSDPAGQTSPDAWRRLAGLGVFELADVEVGTGGIVEQVIVAEELGRVLLGAQYAFTASYVVPLLSLATDGEIAPVILGNRRVSFAGSGRRVVSAGCDLSGEWDLVPGFEPTDAYLLVEDVGAVARIWLAAADDSGVSAEPLHDLDLGSTTVNLRFCQTPSWLVAEVPREQLVSSHQRARLLIAAELIGVAEAAIRAAAEYAKVRVAFGKPIGSYQGVSHPLAGSLAQLEGVRSLLYLTACHLEADTTDAAMLSLAVKARAGAVAVEATGRALHTFGGIGFTWEHPIHRYHRRAIAANATAGSSFELGHQLGLEALACLTR